MCNEYILLQDSTLICIDQVPEGAHEDLPHLHLKRPRWLLHFTPDHHVRWDRQLSLGVLVNPASDLRLLLCPLQMLRCGSLGILSGVQGHVPSALRRWQMVCPPCRECGYGPQGQTAHVHGWNIQEDGMDRGNSELQYVCHVACESEIRGIEAWIWITGSLIDCLPPSDLCFIHASLHLHTSSSKFHQSL